MLLMLRPALVVLVLLLPAAPLAQNQPPVADAGPDQTAFVDDNVCSPLTADLRNDPI